MFEAFIVYPLSRWTGTKECAADFRRRKEISAGREGKQDKAIKLIKMGCKVL